MVLACGAFAAGLVVPPGGIALGEVQPGEAVAAEVVVSNDAGRVISVSLDRRVHYRIQYSQ